jgi:hypothetical protein
MAYVIHQEYLNGFILNKHNPWTYTITDFEYSKQYKQMKKEQKEKEEKERQSRERLNMYNTSTNPTNPTNSTNPTNMKQNLPQVPVNQYFIGTDIYGFNHYSTINSSGILIYYYIDQSGLYHYYN